MNILKLTVENPDELLATGSYGAGALIRVESRATGSLFAEVGTVAIVAGTTLYTYYDTSAATGRYYQTRYSNAGNTNTSDYSDVFQANATLDTYCSLYDAKQRLNIDPTDTTDDENLLQFCGEVTAEIDSFTGRHFLPDPATGTRTYLFDGYDAVENGRCLVIPRGVRSISLLEVASNTGGSFSTIPSADFFIQPNEQERPQGWPGTELWITDIPSATDTLPFFAPGFANIRITGAFAWASTPADITAIALDAVVAKWRGRSSVGGSPIGTSGERTYGSLLSDDEKAKLLRYQLRQIEII